VVLGGSTAEWVERSGAALRYANTSLATTNALVTARNPAIGNVCKMVSTMAALARMPMLQAHGDLEVVVGQNVQRGKTHLLDAIDT